MPGFRNFADWRSCWDDGRVRNYSFRKTFSGTTAQNNWADMNFMSGLPSPTFYASEPLAAATLNGAKGLFHGAPTSPEQQYIHSIMLNTGGTAVATYVICDYLLYYPFVDQSLTDEQAMDNTVTLPRYTSGEGVQMVVVQVFPQTITGTTFVIGYTNSDGVAGRVTPAVRANANSGTSGIVTNGYGSTAIADGYALWVPLQAGDTGVRSVETFTQTVGTDTGMVAIVLVKPLWQFCGHRDAQSPVEKTTFPSAPIPIHDDAFLSGFVLGTASIAGTTAMGTLTTIWR